MIPERPYTLVTSKTWNGSYPSPIHPRHIAHQLIRPHRRRVPSIDSFRVAVDKDLEDLNDAMLPADIEEGHNAIQTKTWKAMRQASHTKFHLFNRFDERVEETRNDLQMLAEVEAKVIEEVKARANQAQQQQQQQAQVQGARAPA